MLAIISVAALVAAAPSAAQTSHGGVAAGERTLRDVEDGSVRCGELGDAEFADIGEFVMERMAGSADAHERMDEAMRGMLGERGLERAHVGMGERFAGCGAGELPGGMGSMMGMLSAIGAAGAGPMMDGRGGWRGMPSGYPVADGDDWDTAAIIVAALLGATLVAGTVALVRALRRAPTADGPLELLAGRYARGEIDDDDYQRRRRALEGRR